MSKQKNFFKTLTAVICFGLSITLLSAEKYAGEIFKMGSGVRNVALGRTGLTDSESTSKAYWNASLLALQENASFEMMHAEEFGGNLQYDVLSGNIGNKSNMGFVVTRIGIDNIKLSKVPNTDSLPSNDNRPFAYKTVNNADYILWLGFGRQVNDKLLIGLSPKIVYRNIAEENAYGFGADISSTWLINNKFTAAARLRDFFTTQMYYENGTHEIVNPGLDLETSYAFQIPKIDKQIKVFVNSEINFENMKDAATISSGMMSLDLHSGLELILNPSFSLYSGYDIDHITAGFSMNYKKFNVNYSFEQNTELDNSHRMSVGVRL